MKGINNKDNKNTDKLDEVNNEDNENTNRFEKAKNNNNNMREFNKVDKIYYFP